MQIIEKERVVTGDKAKELHEKHNKDIYSYEKKELKFKIRENWLPVTCWRLVHDGVKVIALFKSNGITSTTNQLFAGRRAECEAEIKWLKLTIKIEK